MSEATRSQTPLSEESASQQLLLRDMPFEVRVRWELWHSFVSLLRGYAASAGEGVYAVQSSADWARVEHCTASLHFSFDPATGDAVWRRTGTGAEESGKFRIDEDGSFAFASETKAMDIAAIDWLDALRKSKTAAAASAVHCASEKS